MKYLDHKMILSIFELGGDCILVLCKICTVNELPHNKTNKMTVHPAKTQISLVGSGPKLAICGQRSL